MDGRGKDLLDLFVRAGCNEAKSDDIKGDDLGKNEQFVLMLYRIVLWVGLIRSPVARGSFNISPMYCLFNIRLGMGIEQG